MEINNRLYLNQNKTPIVPSFCGYNRTKLGLEIDKFISSGTHSDENSKNLVLLLTKTLKGLHHKKLGEGFRGAVYKIDDKYVLKVNRHLREDDYIPNAINNDLFSGLKSYYGSTLLTFNNYMKVLKNVSSSGKHIPVGITSKESSGMLLSEKNDFWSKKYLPLFASLPQKSYDKIAKDFATLNKINFGNNYFEFDTKNPNNFVLTGKSIRIVDDLDKTLKEAPNCTAGLLRVFLEKMDLDSVAPMDKNNQEMRHTLLKKIVLAGEKFELPHVRNLIDFKTWQYVLDDTCCEYSYLLEQLSKYRELYPDINTRLQNVQHLLDSKITSGYNNFYGSVY